MNANGEALRPSAVALWDTSSSNSQQLASTTTFDSLIGHLGVCDAAKGRWFEMLRRFDLLQTFLAPRPICVIAAVLAISASTLWLWS